MLQLCMEYESWKGLEGLQRAEQVERELREDLGRELKKSDFIGKNLYNVWMALYRFRKGSNKELGWKELDLEYRKLRKNIFIKTRRRFVEAVLVDIVQALGIDDVEDLVNEIRRGRKPQTFRFAKRISTPEEQDK